MTLAQNCPEQQKSRDVAPLHYSTVSCVLRKREARSVIV